MMMRRWLGHAALAASAVACGGEAEPEATMQVAFRQHALKCDRPGMQAKLQVAGSTDCDLVVGADRTVEGVCRRVPTGQVRQLRLVYFATLDPPADPATLDLAVAFGQADLTDQRDAELIVTFDRIDEYPNDDPDPASNLEEWCNFGNPRG